LSSISTTLDWEDGFCLNKSLKPLISLKEHFSSSSSSGSLAHAHHAFQGMDCPFRSPILLVFWDASAALYSFTFLGLFHCLLLLLSLLSLIHRHICDFFPLLSSLGIQPAILSEQPRYHFLWFHWLSLRPLRDYGHPSIGAVTFLSGLEWPVSGENFHICSAHLAACFLLDLLLPPKHQAVSRLHSAFNQEDCTFNNFYVKFLPFKVSLFIVLIYCSPKKP
jgi:hypothetical protein